MVKHLGINLTKHVQNMYVKNYKIMEETKKDLNKRYTVFMDWKIQYCLHIEYSQ